MIRLTAPNSESDWTVRTVEKLKSWGSFFVAKIGGRPRLAEAVLKREWLKFWKCLRSSFSWRNVIESERVGFQFFLWLLSQCQTLHFYPLFHGRSLRQVPSKPHHKISSLATEDEEVEDTHGFQIGSHAIYSTSCRPLVIPISNVSRVTNQAEKRKWKIQRKKVVKTITLCIRIQNQITWKNTYWWDEVAKKMIQILCFLDNRKYTGVWGYKKIQNSSSKWLYFLLTISVVPYGHAERSNYF